MSDHINLQQKLESVRLLMEELQGEDLELFRNQMLSMLLFQGFDAPGNTSEKPLAGLTDEERALILKLARQTEELRKLLDENDPESDQ